MTDINGVLNTVYDPTTVSLRYVEAATGPDTDLPADANGVLSSVLEGDALRVVFV